MKLSTNESTVMTRALCRLGGPGLEVGGPEVLTISEEDRSSLQHRLAFPSRLCQSGEWRRTPRLVTAGYCDIFGPEHTDCLQERCAQSVDCQFFTWYGDSEKC